MIFSSSQKYSLDLIASRVCKIIVGPRAGKYVRRLGAGIAKSASGAGPTGKNKKTKMVAPSPLSGGLLSLRSTVSLHFVFRHYPVPVRNSHLSFASYNYVVQHVSRSSYFSVPSLSSDSLVICDTHRFSLSFAPQNLLVFSQIPHLTGEHCSVPRPSPKCRPIPVMSEDL